MAYLIKSYSSSLETSPRSKFKFLFNHITNNKLTIHNCLTQNTAVCLYHPFVCNIPESRHPVKMASKSFQSQSKMFYKIPQEVVNSRGMDTVELLKNSRCLLKGKKWFLYGLLPLETQAGLPVCSWNIDHQNLPHWINYHNSASMANLLISRVFRDSSGNFGSWNSDLAFYFPNKKRRKFAFSFKKLLKPYFLFPRLDSFSQPLLRSCLLLTESIVRVP